MYLKYSLTKALIKEKARCLYYYIMFRCSKLQRIFVAKFTWNKIIQY